MGCEAANAGFWAVSQTYRTDVGIAAAALSCVGAFCLIAILYAEHTKSIQPSTFLSIYLSITLLLDVARTRSYFLRDNLQVISGFSIGIVMLKVALLLLEEVSKRDLVTGETGECTNDEMFSGFWNRTLFLWLNSTLLRGFRTILSVDNLQDILPEFRSEHVAQEFTLSWEASKEYIFCQFEWFKSTNAIVNSRQEFNLQSTIGLPESLGQSVLHAYIPSPLYHGFTIHTAIPCPSRNDRRWGSKYIEIYLQWDYWRILSGVFLLGCKSAGTVKLIGAKY